MTDDLCAPVAFDLDDSWASDHVRRLAQLVGGVPALERLTDAPLVEAPLDWSSVPEPHRGAATAIIDEIDVWVTTELLDHEYRIVVRRLVHRVASHQPKALSRGDRHRTAAAFVWLALQGNSAFRYGRGLSATDAVGLMFGSGSYAARGRALFHAAGLSRLVNDIDDRRIPDVVLTDPSLQHSSARRRLLRERAQAVLLLQRAKEQREAERAVRPLPDGRVLVRTLPLEPRWAGRFKVDEGRLKIIVADGEGDDERFLSLSVPAARELVSMLQGALDGPLTRSFQAP